jgi:hypothetical protein
MSNWKYISKLAAALLLVFLARERASTARSQQTSSQHGDSAISGEFKEFTDRVHAYAGLHKSAASGVPGGKPTDLPEVIAARQLALARKISEARPNAKRGDIFSDRAAKGFRTVIREQLVGPEGHKARTTIRQGDPLPKLQLKVNEAYPSELGFTTVPPALLLKLPKLPDVLAYRIVGSDFVLLDVEANLVVDFLPDVIPGSVEKR